MPSQLICIIMLRHIWNFSQTRTLLPPAVWRSFPRTTNHWHIGFFAISPGSFIWLYDSGAPTIIRLCSTTSFLLCCCTILDYPVMFTRYVLHSIPGLHNNNKSTATFPCGGLSSTMSHVAGAFYIVTDSKW